MTDLAFDPRELLAADAAGRIRAMEPDPEVLVRLRELEEAHPRRPRRGVLDAIASRLEDGPERTPPPEVDPGPAPEEVPPPVSRPEVDPLPEELPPAPWRRKKWRGHDLYVCRSCGHKTFQAGDAYAHARSHHT